MKSQQLVQKTSKKQEKQKQGYLSALKETLKQCKTNLIDSVVKLRL